MPRFIDFASSILKRVHSNLKPTNITEFNHENAQKYEYHHGQHFVDVEFERIFNERQEAISNGEQYYQGNMQNFYTKSERKLWQIFVNMAKNKSCLEIGAGPVGSILEWYWVKKPIIIEPLANKYRDYQIKKFGKSLYPKNIRLYNQKAEEYITDLENKIDGFILIRNTLDHLEGPLLVMENISHYAKKGCTLLLWSDLWHLVPADEGHRNITKSCKAFQALITGLDFKIEKIISPLRNDSSAIDYGCRAIKI